MLSRVEIVVPAVAVKVRFQMAEETSRAGGGTELYHRAPDGPLMVVPVRRTSKGLQFDAPTAVGISVPAVGHPVGMLRSWQFGGLSYVQVDSSRTLANTRRQRERNLLQPQV
jgi:hypothetical protein